MALSEKEVSKFIEHGFVKIEDAFSKELAKECLAILWRDTGCEANSPTTWTKPVIRLGEYHDAAIVAAAQSHRGSNPKFMAQPALLVKKPFSTQDNGHNVPVEKSIILGTS